MIGNEDAKKPQPDAVPNVRLSPEMLRYQAELQEQELLHSTVLSAVSDAVFITDDRGQFTYVCPNVANIFGYSRQEVCAMHDISCLLGDRLFSRDRLSQDQEIPNIERMIQDRSGRKHHLLITVKEVSIKGGTVLYTCRDITERKHLEQRILELSEQEQNRIGQDLHDGLGQVLTAIAFTAKVLGEKLKAKAAEETPLAEEINRQSAHAKEQVRQLVRGLLPLRMDPLGLTPALRELASQVEERFSVPCHCALGSPVHIADCSTATHLYRIAQEALNNAIRHSGATELRLEILRSGQQISLIIEDNGIGIPPQWEKGPGMGLRIMKYRAEIIGATLNIESTPGQGSRVVCIYQDPKGFGNP